MLILILIPLLIESCKDMLMLRSLHLGQTKVSNINTNTTNTNTKITT